MAYKKVAIVTGAAGGMGLPTVRRLVAGGFTVAALDLNVTELDKIIADEGLDAKAYQIDASSEERCRAVVAQVKTDFGRVDAFVNMIGWTASSRFVEERSGYWNKLIGVNFLPVIFLSHAVAPIMIE